MSTLSMCLQSGTSPQQGINVYAHICLDNRLICLSEHEVRDQDIKERLHFDQ